MTAYTIKITDPETNKIEVKTISVRNIDQLKKALDKAYNKCIIEISREVKGEIK